MQRGPAACVPLKDEFVPLGPWGQYGTQRGCRKELDHNTVSRSDPSLHPLGQHRVHPVFLCIPYGAPMYRSTPFWLP